MTGYDTHGVDFSYNSDFSGQATLTYQGQSLTVPARALLEFVAFAYVLPRRLARLESAAEADDLLLGQERG
jgi:hypothetical protein